MKEYMRIGFAVLAFGCAAAATDAAISRDFTPRLQPGADGPLSARLLADGKVKLENQALQAVFDPADAGAAASLVHKETGKQLAVCVTYGEEHFKAFRETISVQEMREARVDPRGRPYDLIRLNVNGNTATAVFTGYPYLPPAKASPEQLAYGRVRIVKTYTLKSGESRIGVALEVVNESDRPLPVALWLLSGLRVEGENAEAFGPSLTGTISRSDPWTKGGSTFLKIPEAAGSWTAAIGQDTARSGMIIAGEGFQIESVYDWLAKFSGFTLCLGTTQTELPPGASFKAPYAFMVSRDIPRIDAASMELVAGIVFPEAQERTNAVLDVTVWSVGVKGADAAVAMALRKLPATEERKLGETAIRLEPGKGVASSFMAPLDGEGVYVLSATIKTGDGATLHVERPLTIGLADEYYSVRRPVLAGAPFWAAELGEKPLPAWAQECDRDVRFPMVPWNTPSAVKPPSVLFLGEVGWTTGLFRDLARRADLKWDFVNLAGVESLTEGPCRQTEQDAFFKKLEAMNPDVVLSAGIRYGALPPEFLTRLLVRVRQGMGLVIVAAKAEQVKPWLSVLKRPELVRLELPLSPLDEFFGNGIGSAAPFQADLRGCGKGRILLLRNDNLDFYRNDLLPRSAGRAAMPNWEYFFARYVRAIHEAAQAVRPAAIRSVAFRNDATVVGYESRADRQAVLEYDVADTDGVFAEHGTVDVTLKAGTGTVSISAAAWPAAELVVHAWLLDGMTNDFRATPARIPEFLFREGHPGAVLDFAAACVQVTNRPMIAAIEVEGAREQTPSAMTVTLGGAPGWENKKLRVVAEIRNGGETRVVWRGETLAAPGGAVSFSGIRYAPVAAASTIAVQVFDGARLLAVRGKSIAGREIANLADDDFAFITASGVEQWYLPRMMRKWAEEEAGFTFQQINYGLGTGFPWKRKPGNLLDPPIVDETLLRTGTAQKLREAFESKGTAYFALSDEFRLDGEYDFSEPTLQAFSKHLRALYGDIGGLNAEWGTTFTSFDEARPPLLEEARKRTDNPAPWMDFRLFMDRKINRRFEVATEEAARISPLIRVGDSGMYEPGYAVGIDYYRMCQASRFMVSYTGLRADWTQSFMPAGGLMGVWMGYGWQQPWHPWEALFKGYNFLAWWGFIPSKSLPGMAMVRIDGTPNRNFRMIGSQQVEIRRGVGKLFVHARPVEPRVFLAYSQVSAYTANVLGRNYAAASAAAAALPASRNVRYSYVADDQAAAGEVKDRRSVLFVLPGIDALPAQAAEAYAAAFTNGCFILADAEAGWRNGHGRRMAVGGLDDVFGIRRSGSAPVAQPALEAITWTGGAPKELAGRPGQMARALSGVAAGGGTVWAAFGDGTPAIISRTDPAGGEAVWVNTRFEWASRSDIRKAVRPEDEPDELSANETVAGVAGWLMDRLGIRSPVRVEPSSVKPMMAVEFRKGQARYYGLLIGTNNIEATVTLPAKAHTYAVREGRYLGNVDTFKDVFKKGELAKVYAQLPYAVTGLTATPDAKVKHPGEMVTVKGHVGAAGGVSEEHVVHVEMVDPSGGRPAYGISNLSAPAGVFEVRFPLALNAMAGVWHVELADTATGFKTAMSFEVKEPVEQR